MQGKDDKTASAQGCRPVAFQTAFHWADIVPIWPIHMVFSNLPHFKGDSYGVMFKLDQPAGTPCHSQLFLGYCIFEEFRFAEVIISDFPDSQRLLVVLALSYWSAGRVHNRQIVLMFPYFGRLRGSKICGQNVPEFRALTPGEKLHQCRFVVN